MRSTLHSRDPASLSHPNPGPATLLMEKLWSAESLVFWIGSTLFMMENLEVSLGKAALKVAGTQKVVKNCKMRMIKNLFIHKGRFQYLETVEKLKFFSKILMFL